jgi:hypothetical protein
MSMVVEERASKTMYSERKDGRAGVRATEGGTDVDE